MAIKSTTATKSGAASRLESMDKLSSSTLKRNPKMELSKADLLKLLSYLEGELQAREIVIATLKAEKVKQLLQQVKLGGYSMDNPINALQRDAFAACSPGFDELAVQTIYSNQLLALETLIDVQRCSHFQMKEELVKIEQRFAKVLHKLDEERCKNAQDSTQDDDVTYLLEKERGRLKHEVILYSLGKNGMPEKPSLNRFPKPDIWSILRHVVKIESVPYKLNRTVKIESCRKNQITAKTYTLRNIEIEQQHKNNLEKEMKILSSILEQERSKQKQIVLLLLSERKRIIIKLLEERQHCIELEKVLQVEKGRLAYMGDGLEEESQKSLQMEAELEHQLALFKEERNQLKDAIAAESEKSAKLENFNHSLILEVATLKHKTFPEPTEQNTSSGTRVLISPFQVSTAKQTVPSIPPIKPTQASKSNSASLASSTSPCQILQEYAGGQQVFCTRYTSILHNPVSPGLSVTSKPVLRLVHGIASRPSAQNGSSEKSNTVTEPEPEKPSINNVDAHSTSLSSKILSFGGRAPIAKSTVTGHVQPPQPPKKPVAVVRSTPPPVPPNKPVLMGQVRQKSHIGLRPSDGNEADKAGTSDRSQVAGK
uniref:Cortactin-binding protein-2 N-terminal domain-containing protein n=1 Tax=Strigamia maritima TaxID=126957 RepID=T1J9P2_STRMM